MKRTPLKRGKGLAQKRPAKKLVEPGEAEWKRPRRGRCSICGREGKVVLHHVVDERTVRNVGGDPYDPRNALVIGAPYAWSGPCHCHSGHHLPGVNDTRIPFEKVPEDARVFAQETLGVGPAAMYFATKYQVPDP